MNILFIKGNFELITEHVIFGIVRRKYLILTACLIININLYTATFSLDISGSLQSIFSD